MPNHKVQSTKYRVFNGKRLPAHFENGWIVENKHNPHFPDHATKKKPKTVTKVMNFNTVILNDKASDVFPELENIKSSSKTFPDDKFKTVLKQIKNQLNIAESKYRGCKTISVDYINYFDAKVEKPFQTKGKDTTFDSWNMYHKILTMQTRCFYSIMKFHRCSEIHGRFTDATYSGIEKYHEKLIKDKSGLKTSEGATQLHETSINWQNDNWYFSKNPSKNRQVGFIGSWLKNSNVRRDIVSLGSRGFRIILEIPNKTSNLLEGRCNRLIIHTKRILGTEKIKTTELESRCSVRIYGNKNLFSEEDGDKTLDSWRYPDETETFMNEKRKRRIRHSKELRMDRLYKHTSTLFIE